MPAPHRRFTASIERGGIGVLSASRISPSVIVSQRQITRP
jgi:hypothetical protein